MPHRKDLLDSSLASLQLVSLLRNLGTPSAAPTEDLRLPQVGIGAEGQDDSVMNAIGDVGPQERLQDLLKRLGLSGIGSGVSDFFSGLFGQGG